MRINVLQHTPNEGPGSIKEWATRHGHELYVYHPYQFDVLPSANETDFLVILGGPMSPNDELEWIRKERVLINELIQKNVPIFGVCYGAQQIAKALGYKVSKAPYKEVGFAPVYLKSKKIKSIPDEMTVLHWHEEMFEVPIEADLLFSSDLVENQGFIIGDTIVGLQFHLEPQKSEVIEIAINDVDYPNKANALKQTTSEILSTNVPKENQEVLFTLLDYITK